MYRIGIPIALLALASGCFESSSEVTRHRETPQTRGQLPRFSEDDELRGLRMRLREVRAPAAGEVPLPLAEGEALPPDRIEELLSRVEVPEAAPEARRSFAQREGSPPPPLSGQTLDLPFPPPDAPPHPEETEPGALEILRYAPEGEIPMAPHLSVTFSRPMVAVTSQREAARSTPAKLSPRPAGRWRWLGTRTLLFEPEGRFPMATDYRVSIPAGTRSASGDLLGEQLDFAFSTPALRIEAQHPTSGPTGLEPVIFIAFDQRVEPQALLSFLTLTGGGSHPLRPATPEEIESDRGARALRERTQEGRWIALKPERPLPRDTWFSVTLREDAPSAEGPRKTAEAQSFEFFTYAPLKVVDHGCPSRDPCPPDTSWIVRFNNPLEEGSHQSIPLTAKPEVPGLRVERYRRRLAIDGVKRGRTAYEVTLPGSLADVFGQALGSDETLYFHVGPAPQTLFGPGRQLVTLDPAGPPEFSVYSTNWERLAVRVYRVQPEHWEEWATWLHERYGREPDPDPPPGEKVLDTELEIEREEDRLVETRIDLGPYLREGYGQFILWVEPTEQPEERWRRQQVTAWVQVTQLGLTAFADREELVAWVTTLGDGEAAEGVELQVLPDGLPSGSSDAEGLARLALLANPTWPQVLVARRGADTAILPRTSAWGWSGAAGWRRVEQREQLRWYAFDDRGLYRPGEDARVKGWIRRYQPGKGGDISGLGSFPKELTWKLRGPRGNDLDQGKTELSALGGFDLKMELPADVDLGTASLHITAAGGGNLDATSHVHPIRIQEFRRPEFEVRASAEPGPILLGEETVVGVEAAYYAGGGLPGAPVRWDVTAQPGRYTPPNRSDFHFGTWSPWWWRGPIRESEESRETLEGETDALGQHHLAIHFESMNPPQPMRVRAEARVTDVNRQTWSARSALLVHPASLYVGLRAERGFVGKGEPIELDVLAVDTDGNAAPGVEVAVRMARLAWAHSGGRWVEEEVDPQECRVSSAAEPVSCRFEPELGGSYRLLASARDPQGRRNQSELRVWVAGGETPPAREVERERVTLIPEREEYRPGETAELLVQAPFYPAQGLLTVRRSGLVHSERFQMAEPSRTLRVPILESHIPNITVQVDLVGTAPRTDDRGRTRDDLPRRPAYASGSLRFSVPPLARTLRVTATPRETALEPGGKTELDVSVMDAAGQPVGGAEVAAVVVDESVLALTDYRLPDPLEIFYAARPAGVSDHHQRSQVMLSDPLALEQMAAESSLLLRRESASFAESSPQMEGAGAGRRARPEAAEMRALGYLAKSPPSPATSADGAPIALRSDFAALALFAPELSTDPRGRATVAVELPDSLTRYRVMAVAAAGGKQFGSGESQLTARLPLMLRPSPPRFLNFGDRFALSVVLQNQTDEALSVDLALRAANARFTGRPEKPEPAGERARVDTAGRRVTVPRGQRVEVRFPAAPQAAGRARFQAVAASASHADAAGFELPVWTPATAEAFATYGEVAGEGDADAVVQPVRAPSEVWPQFGGLEITTSSTQLQALTDALLYLVEYPFECAEQISSRILAVAALRGVLTAFEAEGLPAPEELEASVGRDLEKLKAIQNHDGGFPFWRKGEESWPYLSLHAAHAMARAAEKGYPVDERMWERSRSYLRRIDQHIPESYSPESRWALQAYALYVRLHMDDADTGEARELLEEAGVERLPLEAQGWILPVLQAGGAEAERARVERHLMNRVTETAGGAHFITDYSDGAHVLLHSARRVDGVILEALLAVSPESELIPKLVRGLLAHRKRGKWSNTQENAFILLALDRYWRTYESLTPDFVARAWLGDVFAGEHRFQGRTTERAHIEIPMRALTEMGGERPLILAREGQGRLYYRIGMRYAPRNLELAAADYGFAVSREYQPVDEGDDVSRDEDGTWRIEAGARVRVRLTLVAPTRRYHVALVDPLPAGLEPINPELAVSESLPEDAKQRAGYSRYWWWWRPWYEHQNLRDERVEAFTSLLWAGVHSYTYVARATTPGEFTAPPTRAEEMYHPETFGRSATDRVVVE